MKKHSITLICDIIISSIHSVQDIYTSLLFLMLFLIINYVIINVIIIKKNTLAYTETKRIPFYYLFQAK